MYIGNWSPRAVGETETLNPHEMYDVTMFSSVRPEPKSKKVVQKKNRKVL